MSTWRKRIFLLTFIAVNVIDPPSPEVKIQQGIISGRISRNGKFYEYLGIPYATTSSETRFQAPLPPPTWEGVFKATDEHFSCPQKLIGPFVSGEEDCLKINIYVPVNHSKRKLPVMIYIHGGAFAIGSGGRLVYAGDFFVQKNVIFVTFNYRLGPLGFICLGIKEAPGNAGLKDQVAALRWVKKNIVAFNGDDENITVFGESAGGASTSHLVLSKTTDGLFSKVIIQSGSSIAHWAVNRDPTESASLLVKHLGYETKNPFEIYKILMRADYKQLIKINLKRPQNQYFETELMHLPCVEKHIPDVEPVITDLPTNIFSRGDYKKLPTILGFNNREGLFLVGTRENTYTAKMKNHIHLFPRDLEFNSQDEEEVLARKVRDLYFPKKEISEPTDLVDLYSDIFFKIPGIIEAEAVCLYSNCYTYIFEYSGSRNIVKYAFSKLDSPGASHGDELLYLFDAKIWPLRITSSDKKLIDQMTTMWTNFAKFGNPTPEITKELPIPWARSKANNLTFLHIGEELKLGPIENSHVYSLWKDVYRKYSRNTLNY